MKDKNSSQLQLLLISVGAGTLLLHFYYCCYAFFAELHLTNTFLERFVGNMAKSGLFRHLYLTKIAPLGLFLISLFLTDTTRARPMKKKTILFLSIFAAAFLFEGDKALLFPGSVRVICTLYIVVTLLGYIMAMLVIINIISFFRIKLAGDVFNKSNETFPQEERLLVNPYSINLNARYRFRDQTRRSRINIINPFRGTAVYGSPGSGKTYYIIRHIISQSLKKGFILFVYDFKFDDLTRITYNNYLRYENSFSVKPDFHVIDFDHLMYSARCNALDPASLEDVSDASESARTILLALNREWIPKQGDFFVESAISFTTAAIWFLRQYENGKYCTLPHLIEFISMDYAQMFTVLRSIPEIETMVNPFLTLFLNGSTETLDSQIASARIALASLASPRIYYVLSGDDFNLDINNPDCPKIVCMGSNAQKQQIYGAVLSLYITRMIKLVNRKGQLPSHIILDELTTTYIPGIPNLMATARSNKVAVTFAAQSISLLRSAYGQAQAEVLFSLPGNVFCGQANSDTAKLMSECIGKIVQSKQSISQNSKDSSYSQSEHLDAAVPPSTIAGLSSGEFVGYVADDPSQKIKLKAFHCEIINDSSAIKKEEAQYEDLPVIRKEEEVTSEELEANFSRIKLEVSMMVANRIDQMRQSPLLVNKIIVRPERQQKNRRVQGGG